MFTEKSINLLKVRAFLLKNIREYLDKQGFFEIQGPILVPAVAGSSNSFEVNYYRSKTYLTKGLLPYGKSIADHLEKVYSVSPSFRKETRSGRHLTEYWRIEVVIQGDLENIMCLQEKLITNLCNSLSEIDEILKPFNRLSKDFTQITLPYQRLTYDDAIELLQTDGFRVFWGQELSWAQQKHLSLKLKKPFFIWKSPYTSDTFFCKSDSKTTELTCSADLFAPEGYGEIASSIEMLSGEKLQSRLAQAQIGKESQEWLLKFYENKSNQHSTFAMGIERLMQWICKIEKIEQTILFPRTSAMCYP